MLPLKLAANASAYGLGAVFLMDQSTLLLMHPVPSEPQLGSK